jgi:hypothetical protein
MEGIQFIQSQGVESWWPKPTRYSLTYNGVTTILKTEPDTWQDYTLEWKMDTLFWTRALSLGIPTKFIKDGKEIIDRAFRERGVNAEVMFKIERFDYTTGVWAYKTIYHNRLNFTSLISERDYAELESEPQGLMALLARKGDQEFEIDMTDGKVVNYDRIEFNQYAEYHVVGLVRTSGQLNDFIPTIIVDEENVMRDKYGNKTIEFQSIAFFTGSEDSIISNGMYFIKCLKSISFQLNIDIGIKINESRNIIYSEDTPPIVDNPDGTLSVRICDRNKNVMFETIKSNWYITGDTSDGIISIKRNYEINTHFSLHLPVSLMHGNEYYIIFKFTGYDESTVDRFEMSTNITAQTSTWKYRGDHKQINTINPEQLGKRLLAKITEGQIGTFDFQLPATYNQYAITCGDAIRGTADAKIKTTFNNLFRTYSRLFQLKMDIVENADGSETATMKLLEDFFEAAKPDGSNVIDLGEVTELRWKPWVDQTVNTIKVGYEDNSYENSDGKGEFNTELQFSTPITSKTNTLDLMIPYRADSYGIEYVLIDFEKDATTDSKADNDVFLIHVNGNNEVNRSVPISGTYADSTMFNAALSPKSILRRNGRLISSMLDKIQPVNGKNVIFGSSKKDRDVVIGGVHERESELLNAAKIFKPIIIEFYTGLKDFNAYEVMRRNPNGIFRFSFMGKQYRGYVFELQVKPAINQAQDWQVICHPDTDT